jgi:hypothetical protein
LWPAPLKKFVQLMKNTYPIPTLWDKRKITLCITIFFYLGSPQK